MNDQVLETKDEIAQSGENQIVEFNIIEAAIAVLKELYGDTSKFDVSTPAALKKTKQELSDLASYRINLEKARVKEKAPHIAKGIFIDDEAKRIQSKIAEIEDPIRAKVKAEEKRLADIKAEEERFEALRVEGHERQLASIREWPLDLVGADLESLRKGREGLASIPVDSFEEFQESATLYKQVALEKMDRMIETAEQAELQTKINEENARVAATEKAEKERVQKVRDQIASIRNHASFLFGKSLGLLIQEKEFIESIRPSSDYIGFEEDAELAKSDALTSINVLISAAQQKQKDDEELVKLRADAAKAEQDKIDQDARVTAAYEKAKIDPNFAPSSAEFTASDEANFKEVFTLGSEAQESPNNLTRTEIIIIVADHIGISLHGAEQQIINAFK